MSRRRPLEDAGNLDSLLDALTNVVGILIIMLVVALLGMSEAVKRITQAQELDDKVDVDHLLDKEKELQALKELLKQLEPDWLEMEPQVPKHKVQLQKLKNQVESLSEKIKVESQDKDIDIDKMESDFKEKSETQKKLDADLKKAIKRLEELKALLDKTPVLKIPPAEIVRIPNPRDVDKSYRKVTFHIQKKRVIQEETQRYRKRLEKNIATFKKRFKPVAPTSTHTGGYDYEKFKELMGRTKYSDRNVNVKLKHHAYGIYMDFYITEKAGDDIKTMENSGSKYQRAIRKIKRKGKQYARYKVASDSFAEYVKARNIADKIGIPAGWEADTNSKDRNWYTYVKHNMTFNKVKPKPKPKSSQSSSKPKPKPKKEKRKPLRDSVVD